MVVVAKKNGKKKSKAGVADAEDDIEAKEDQALEDSLDGNVGIKTPKKKAKSGNGKSPRKKETSGKSSASTSLGGSDAESEELAPNVNVKDQSKLSNNGSQEIAVEGSYFLTDSNLKSKKPKEKKSKEKRKSERISSASSKKSSKRRSSLNLADATGIDSETLSVLEQARELFDNGAIKNATTEEGSVRSSRSTRSTATTKSTKSTASKKTKKRKKKRKSKDKNNDVDMDNYDDENQGNDGVLSELDSSIRSPYHIKERKRKSEKKRSEKKQFSKSRTPNHQEEEMSETQGDYLATTKEIDQLRRQLKQAMEDLETARLDTAAAMDKAEKATNQLAIEKQREKEESQQRIEKASDLESIEIPDATGDKPEGKREREDFKQKQSPQVTSEEWTRMQMEIKRSNSELADLRSEVEEYEEAIQEKDGLIKKLTEAVDCQLDKVEYLELKLQRAEDEFCKMEDEMKDLEDEIEDLKLEPITESTAPFAADSLDEHPPVVEQRSLEGSSVGNFGEQSTHENLSTREERHRRGIAPVSSAAAQSPSSIVTLRQLPDEHRKYVEERIQKIKLREKELTERESDLYMREQDVLERERDMDGREEEILQETELEFENKMDMIRMRELRVKEREREMLKLEEDLANQEHELEERELDLEDALKHGLEVTSGEQNQSSTENSHNDTRQTSKMKVLREQIEDLRLENEDLRQQIYQDEEDATDLVEDLESQIKDLREALEEVREENDELRLKDEARLVHQKKIQEQRDYELQIIQDGINRQLQELDDENTKLLDTITILEEENDSIRKKHGMRRRSISSSKSHSPDVEADPNNRAIAELEVEIAKLREKIVDSEREAQSNLKEVDQVRMLNEEHRTEIMELETEVATLRSQLNDYKNGTLKKMKQKDETIKFLQNEIIRVGEEKQTMNNAMVEREKLLLKEKEQKANDPGEDVGSTQAQTFSDKLMVLEKKNQSLQEKSLELKEKLNQSQFESNLSAQEKEATILQLQQNISEMKWELKSRKERDHTAYQKYIEARKEELEATKRNLKEAEEKIAVLERRVEESQAISMDTSSGGESSGVYVVGLKRQIKSLKEHNLALERRIINSASSAAEAVARKEKRIRKLEQDLKDMHVSARNAVHVSSSPEKQGTYNDSSSLADRLSETTNATSSMRISTASEFEGACIVDKNTADITLGLEVRRVDDKAKKWMPNLSEASLEQKAKSSDVRNGRERRRRTSRPSKKEDRNSSSKATTSVGDSQEPSNSGDLLDMADDIDTDDDIDFSPDIDSQHYSMSAADRQQTNGSNDNN